MTPSHPQASLILASASPRRRRILADLGAHFTVKIPDVTEVAFPNDPAGTARENAARKHAWCRARNPHAPIITADTVLDFDGRMLGKPDSLPAAKSMLRALAGRTHTVCTAVALAATEIPVMHLCQSTVTFRELTDAEIENYVRLVNPLDKAGAYDIADHGELLIASHNGSTTNIMGLSIELVRPWLLANALLDTPNRPLKNSIRVNNNHAQPSDSRTCWDGSVPPGPSA